MKRKVTVALVLSMFFCVSVSAASTQKGNVVSFDMETRESGKMTAVITTKGENTIRWIGVVTADSEGMVNFNAELDDYYDDKLSDGMYTLTLSGENKYKKYSEDFSFKSTPTREKVLESITDADSVLDLFHDPNVRDELNGMGLFIDEFCDLSEENQNKVASKVAQLAKKTEKSMSEEIGPYIIYLKCMEDGSDYLAENFSRYANDCFEADLGISLYKKIMEEKDEKALYNYMKELGDSAVGKLKNGFEDALITSLFRSTIDAGEMQRILSTYGEYAGLDMNKYNHASDKRSFAIHMIGADYNSGAEIQKRYNSYSPKSTDNNQSGNGSGGSKPISNNSGSGLKIDTSGSSDPIMEYQPVQSIEEKYSFSDMADYAWANEAVAQLAARGIISGVGDNMFAPSRMITREEFAKLISLAFEIKDEGNVTFIDVPSDRWSCSAISALANAGIISGVGNNMFAPDAWITRQDMAVMIDRALAKKGVSVESQKKEDFTDMDDVSDYAKDSVAGLYKSGFVAGMGDGSFKPMNNLTRAEAAQIVYNCFKVMGGEGR
jgi:hypothetical protein